METMLDLENLEHAIIAEKGDEKGNEFLERVATSPAHMYSFEEAKKYHDYRDQIEALLETLKLNHIIIENPNPSDIEPLHIELCHLVGVRCYLLQKSINPSHVQANFDK